MSLVTRCPACATTFKVVRDQLRISDGWVRCGRCSEVFDATADLQEVPESAPSPAVSSAGEGAGGPAVDTDAPDEARSLLEPEAKPEPEPGPGPRSQPDAWVPSGMLEMQEGESPAEFEETDFFDDEQQAAPPVAPPAPPLDAAPASKPAPEAGRLGHPASPEPLRFIGIVTDEPWVVSEPPISSMPLKPSYPPFPKIDLTLSSERPVQRDPVRSAQPDAVDTGNSQFQKALRRAREKSAKARARHDKAAARESAPIVQTASEPELARADAPWSAPVLSAGERGEFWRRPATRRWLRGLTVLAALLLVLQVLQQERDLIVARQPGLRPAFALLCRVSGCELSALRRISDITIDGASFAREKGGDGYRLSFSLRNAAAIPLAMPAVELTLLDMQERAVVRRVLTPAEFGAPAVLPARAERAASLPLALAGPEAAALPPIAGYRVVAFYP